MRLPTSAVRTECSPAIPVIQPVSATVRAANARLVGWSERARQTYVPRITRSAANAPREMDVIGLHRGRSPYGILQYCENGSAHVVFELVAKYAARNQGHR